MSYYPRKKYYGYKKRKTNYVRGIVTGYGAYKYKKRKKSPSTWDTIKDYGSKAWGLVKEVVPVAAALAPLAIAGYQSYKDNNKRHLSTNDKLFRKQGWLDTPNLNNIKRNIADNVPPVLQSYVPRAWNKIKKPLFGTNPYDSTYGLTNDLNNLKMEMVENNLYNPDLATTEMSLVKTKDTNPYANTDLLIDALLKEYPDNPWDLPTNNKESLNTQFPKFTPALRSLKKTNTLPMEIWTKGPIKQLQGLRKYPIGYKIQEPLKTVRFGRLMKGYIARPSFKYLKRKDQGQNIIPMEDLPAYINLIGHKRQRGTNKIQYKNLT